MKLITLLFFLRLSHAYVNLEECAIDRRSLENVWENRLEDKIMCNYDANVPPLTNKSVAVHITPHFFVQQLEFWSESELLSLYAMTFLGWTDKRLTWDPKDYDGIKEVVKNGSQLWLPGIKLYNSIDNWYGDIFGSNMYCRISSNGYVECVFNVLLRTICIVNLSHWPFDTQVCSLEFVSLSVRGTKVRFDSVQHSMRFLLSERGAEWEIMDAKEEENPGAEIELKISLTLMRHAEVIAVTVIFPSVLLSILTFSILFLDVRQAFRVYMVCFSLLCHFYFLSELDMIIPKNSKSTPTILLYSRGSVIITTITTFLTFLMKLLIDREATVPKLIAVVTEHVYKSKGKLFIYPHWASTTDDDNRELAKVWSDFVSLLNSVWIYISLIVYIVMCSAFIPLPSGLKQNTGFLL